MSDFENKIIREFNNFMKVMIKNARINFYNLNSARMNRIVSFDEPTKLEASLSIEDNGAFSFNEYVNIDELSNYFENVALIDSINNLNPTEKKLIEFLINNIDDIEISAKLNIKVKTIQNRKSIIKNKIKNDLGGIDYERKNK